MSTQSVEDALGSVSESVYALAGAGVAAINNDGTWEGSLNYFDSGDGYWLVANDDFSFNFNNYIIIMSHDLVDSVPQLSHSSADPKRESE